MKINHIKMIIIKEIMRDKETITMTIITVENGIKINLEMMINNK